ncbi:hypothetical protein OSG_eHP18_00115 [environmental Halophage eHP-18]|nr:hypothetical protein OSG_eHP17_00025 [environmental Halophage eHP-17]AFH22180.1 hypothetical protein OSG_eHP18_00115 [environmental Halophage eHP-18]AFH22708.1 hypothetical protein OSG_eHP33_00025 [environmental Halophage eHP-33]
MTWDDDKSTAADPDNPNADEQLTASEWNTHVDEGHWPSDELQFQIDNGDPVLVDPQNSNEIVARYDRGKGGWVIDTLEADSGTIAQLKADNVVLDKDSNPSTHSTENISVQADETVVVFDLADPVDVLGGYYKAERTGAVIYEFDDGSTNLIGGQSTRSNDSAGDTYDIGKIYPAVNVVKISVDILTTGNAAFHATTI